MEHHLNLSNMDVFKALFYVHIRNKFLWGLCLFLGSIMHFFGFVGLWAMGWPPKEVAIGIFDFVTWLFTLNMIGFFCTVLALLFNPKWRKGRLGEHKVTITEQGLIEETKYNKTEIRWPAISSITARKKLIYLPHSAADIFVIPRSSFSNEQDYNSFIKELTYAWESGVNV